MYLLINNTRHACTRRIVTEDTIRYLGVEPAPAEITGAAQLYRDDGFLMSEDNLDSFARKIYTGTLLTVTNVPEPQPVEPGPYVPTDTDILNTLLGVNTHEQT